jgi:hypothetical protein
MAKPLNELRKKIKPEVQLVAKTKADRILTEIRNTKKHSESVDVRNLIYRLG